MRVAAILRGFPGLGRVIAGVELTTKLRDYFEAEVRVYTYLQGAKYADSVGLSVASPVMNEDICSIGIVPVSRSGESIIERVLAWPADLVILDGEPLLVHALGLVHKRGRMLVLLNPSDVQNSHNIPSSQAYFNDCYSRCDVAVVHGLWQVAREPAYKGFYSLPTILRTSVLDLKPSFSERRIICILGGGSVNAAREFSEATLAMGAACVGAAQILDEFVFVIYAGTQAMAQAIQDLGPSSNVEIHGEFGSPSSLYGHGRVVVARAGRNTLSEILYLGMPAAVFATNDAHRGSEQRTNLTAAKRFGGDSVVALEATGDGAVLAEAIGSLVTRNPVRTGWVPGNALLDSILSELGVG